MSALRDSSCTVFPQSDDVLTSADVNLSDGDKRATNCTSFPTSDDPIISFADRGTEIHTTQVTRQISSNSSVPNSSPARVLGRGLPGAKRPSQSEFTVSDAKRLSGFVKDGSPWSRYRRFVKLGSSGKCFLSTDSHERRPRIIAVKESMLSEPRLKQNVIKITHPNIVQLQEAWSQNDRVYLIYERMDITLDRLQQFFKLKEEYISLICRDILNALRFIHNELQIHYAGSIYDNVYFSYDGAVKLGNIGNSLMSGSGSPEGNDVQSIGTLILRIMQPGTMYKNPDETNLQNSHGWSNDMVDFLKAAWTSGLEELLMHSFVTTTPTERDSLAQMIWIADKKVRLDWSVCD